jgi:predicted restriction endonuclease
MHIDNEYVIRISSKVTNQYYRGFDGKRITLPKDENYHPSRGALAERKTDYRP